MGVHASKPYTAWGLVLGSVSRASAHANRLATIYGLGFSVGVGIASARSCNLMCEYSQAGSGLGFSVGVGIASARSCKLMRKYSQAGREGEREGGVWPPSPFQLRSTHEGSNQRLGAQVDIWELKSTSGSSNRRLGAQINAWEIRLH